MRADVNVSVRRTGGEFGTRCEIKNVNSIRFVGQAIEYEARRQIDILEDGGSIDQETRLYDPERPVRFAVTAGTVLSGAHTRFQIIDTSEQEYVAGVAFKPGGSALIMRAPAHEFSDVDVPLDAEPAHVRHSFIERTHRVPELGLGAADPGMARAFDASHEAELVGRLRQADQGLPHPPRGPRDHQTGLIAHLAPIAF